MTIGYFNIINDDPFSNAYAISLSTALSEQPWKVDYYYTILFSTWVKPDIPYFTIRNLKIVSDSEVTMGLVPLTGDTQQFLEFEELPVCDMQGNKLPYLIITTPRFKSCSPADYNKAQELLTGQIQITPDLFDVDHPYYTFSVKKASYHFLTVLAESLLYNIFEMETGLRINGGESPDVFMILIKTRIKPYTYRMKHGEWVNPSFVSGEIYQPD